IVEDDSDAVCLRIVDIDQVAHAVGEVAGGALLRDLHLAPGPVRVEEDEQVDGAVAAIFAVVALGLPGRGRDRLRTSPISWVGLSSKHTTGRLGSGASA